jgi:tagatose-6-phosphate ketose/aldose isomerase
MMGTPMTPLQLDEKALERQGALWTAREIAQQPASWERTLILMRERESQVSAFLEPLLARRELRIILTGAGSSSFIGECLAPNLSQRLNRQVEALATTDLLSGPRHYLRPGVPTLLVSFGRSGASPESVAVVELAEKMLDECHQLIITCNEAGTLYQRCQGRPQSLALLMPSETHDQSFAMTSSFTSMMLAAWLAFCGMAGHADQLVVRIATSTRRLLDEHNNTFRELAAKDYSRVVYLGSNGLKAIAREAALKLLELTDGKVVATYESSLGFRHGPKTIVNDDTLLVMFLSNDTYTRGYDIDLLRELRADRQAGAVLAVTAKDGAIAAEGDTLQIAELEAADDAQLAFPYLVCAQLYAFHCALRLGNAPDDPNVSATVSRVVSGVTVYTL